ncbi:MAG: tetratricopeptide repeat protein [Myxococcota bacterium]
MAPLDDWGAAYSPGPAHLPASWTDTVLALCGHRADAGDHLQRCLGEDPGFLPALCAKGLAALFRGQNARRVDALAAAQEARASEAERGSTFRERALIEVLEHWARDEMTEAAQVLERLVEDTPTDLLALKLQHGLLFIAGRPRAMRASLESALPRWSAALPGYGYFLGCLSFALGETGAFDASEAIGRRAVEAEPSDAWGVHAVAHVMESTDRIAEGATWLQTHRDSYAACSVFRGHVYWHEALFLCELGRYDQALAVYDAEVARPWCGDYRDMSNASSLLWRLEADGVEVGERWAALADIAMQHCSDHGSAFADAHYLLALARGSESGARALLGSLVAYVERGGSGDQFAVVRDHGLPLCRAIYASERRQCSAEELDRLAASTLPLGGSTAQRDLFSLYAIDAARRCGDGERARKLLEARLRARPNNRWALARLELERDGTNPEGRSA